MARSVYHWITSHSHSRKQSSQSMHFMSTQKRCETTPKAAKYDLVLKQNMLPKMSCNNHNSKSYAVKRLSNWIEAGWKSWTSLSANRFGFLRAIQRHDSSRKYLQKKIGTVCHEAFDEPNLENMQRYLQKQHSRKPRGTSTWKSLLIMWIVLWAMQTLLKVRQICAACRTPMHSFLFECDRWQSALAWCKHQSSLGTEHSTETQPEIQIPNRYS